MGRLTFFLLLLGISCCNAGCTHAFRRHHDTIAVQLHQEPSEQQVEQALHKAEKAAKLIEHGKLHHAEKELNEAIRIAPTVGMAHNNLGLVYYQRRQLYEAAHAYQRVIELMPSDPVPYNNLGMVCERGDRIDDAVRYYQDAHLLCPQSPEYLGNLLRARLRRGDCDESIRWMLKELIFVETRPEWVEWARQELCVNLPRLQGIPDPEVCTDCPPVRSNAEPGADPLLGPPLPEPSAPGKVRLPPLPAESEGPSQLPHAPMIEPESTPSPAFQNI